MKIRVAIGGKESSFTALHDTGNTLRNPVDGRPVLVMEQAAVMDLLPAADAAILREKPTPEIAMQGSTPQEAGFILHCFRFAV